MIGCFGTILMLLSSSLLIGAYTWDWGYEYGKKEERQKVIVLCNEKPTDCKIEYEFYKLQENQNKRVTGL